MPARCAALRAACSFRKKLTRVVPNLKPRSRHVIGLIRGPANGGNSLYGSLNYHAQLFQSVMPHQQVPHKFPSLAISVHCLRLGRSPIVSETYNTSLLQI
ncbi:hypothetical protein J6590_063913 [Homalodisca vitripennis]|nr:hypothetical protein J6590_063913 [Homalodisca vitripennis]